MIVFNDHNIILFNNHTGEYWKTPEEKRNSPRTLQERSEADWRPPAESLFIVAIQ